MEESKVEAGNSNPSSMVQISSVVGRLSNFPSVTEYGELCKIAAERCFSSGNELDGVYYLSESHAINLRHNAEQAANSLIRKGTSKENVQENLADRQILVETLCPKIWKDVVGFRGRYSAKKGAGVVDRIRELPKEWTVVQVTAGYDIRFAINPVRHEYSNPSCLYICRMECGSECPVVYSAAVRLTAANLQQNLRPIVKDGTKSFLEELRDLIQDNKSVNADPKKFRSAAQYWNLRAEHNGRMKLLLSDIEKHWLRGWKCLFLGKIRDLHSRKKVDAIVESILESQGILLDSRCRAILHQVVAAYPSINQSDLRNILKDIFPNSDDVRTVEKAIEDATVSAFSDSPCQWKRHPVILILDKRIERIPWEVLPLLRNHPFSRVPSVHFLHGLALKDDNQSIAAEEPQVDPRRPFYVVNPDGSLPGTEKRMVKYLKCRPEAWDGMKGIEPSAEEFLNVVRSHNLVLYSGHGSGGRYLQKSLASGGYSRVAMLLMGCRSVATHSMGAKLDPWGIVFEYMAARSPCVVGMLWDVTDLECDLVTMSLIDNWLGQHDSEKSKANKEKVEKESRIQPVLMDSNKKLLEALVTARFAAKQFMTSAAMVTYGVPVKSSKF